MLAKTVESASQEKKSHAFLIFYLLFAGLLLVCSYLFLQYVWQSISLFEKAQPNHCVNALIEDISRGEGLEYIVFPEIEESEFEAPGTITQDYLNKIQTAKLTCKFAKEDYLTGERFYNLYADEEPVGKVVLSLISQENRLLILNLNFYEVNRVEPLINLNVFEYDICVTDKDKVFVNDWELSEQYLKAKPEEISKFQYLYEYTDMPKMVTYHVGGLYEIPEIRVENESGEALEVVENNNTVELVSQTSTQTVPQEVADRIDCLQAAKTWSLFTTGDLPGAAHGLATVQNYFIPDSYYWKKLKEYAYGIDINYVSAHSAPVFSEEAVSEYTRYTPDCFSCRIKFHKSMRIASGRMQEEDMDSIFYFVQIEDGTWRIADIQ